MNDHESWSLVACRTTFGSSICLTLHHLVLKQASSSNVHLPSKRCRLRSLDSRESCGRLSSSLWSNIWPRNRSRGYVVGLVVTESWSHPHQSKSSFHGPQQGSDRFTSDWNLNLKMSIPFQIECRIGSPAFVEDVLSNIESSLMTFWAKCGSTSMNFVRIETRVAV